LSQLFLLIGIVWFCYELWRIFCPAPPPRFSPWKNWALALAQPMVDAVKMTGFFEANTEDMTEHTRALFRTSFLHQMGLRTDTSNEYVQQYLARTFELQWFRIDLQKLMPTDDPRAALAFACVRTAFFTRNAMNMKWLDVETAWRVLLQNARRAQECFTGWEDFGRAYIIGRRQWVMALRADALGSTFEEIHLSQLLAPPKGAWSALVWPKLRDSGQ
jgi:hypothetical protein